MRIKQLISEVRSYPPVEEWEEPGEANPLISRLVRCLELATETIEATRPVVESARGNIERVEGEWGAGSSFEGLVASGDVEAVEAKNAIDALLAYDAVEA